MGVLPVKFYAMRGTCGVLPVKFYNMRGTFGGPTCQVL